jgi:hypothetical protein
VGQARGDKEYVLPVKGLNTESNLLHFPQEFSPSLSNMEIDYSPQVVRPRKGIAITGSATLAETRNASAHDVAIHSFLWEAVAGDPEKNFIVVQVGRYLYFFDDGTFAAYASRNDINDLLSGTSKGTLALAEPTRVDFANVKGNLLMCSAQIDPVLFNYDDGINIVGTSLTLQMRDMLGIDDGLETDERPTTLSDDHRYNLLNQGWAKKRRNTSGSAVESDPITTFFGAFTPAVYPSNADIPFLAMVEDAGDLIFDPEWLRDQTFGSTPSAKGHYTVDIFSIDRDAVIVDPSFSGGLFGGSYTWNPNWSAIPTYATP